LTIIVNLYTEALLKIKLQTTYTGQDNCMRQIYRPVMCTPKHKLSYLFICLYIGEECREGIARVSRWREASIEVGIAQRRRRSDVVGGAIE